MAFVSVPKDLTKVKNKIIFNLTKRQLICFGIAAAVGLPFYFLSRGIIGSSNAATGMCLLMLPAFLFAMYEKDGLPLEKVLKNMITVKFIRPPVRKYQMENMYEKKYTVVRKKKGGTKGVKKNYTFRAPLEEIYDFCVLEYSFSIWQWGTDIRSIPETSASDDTLLDHLLAISGPSYFIVDSPTLSFFVQAARELGYYGYDIAPFKPYLSIKTSKDYLRRLMLPEDMRKMKFDKTLSNKIVRFLKKNDPKMIFIYGQNDPWTAAGVTWLKNKKNIHVFVEPGGSHLARIGTMSEDQKQKVMSLLRGWLEE